MEVSFVGSAAGELDPPFNPSIHPFKAYTSVAGENEAGFGSGQMA